MFTLNRCTWSFYFIWTWRVECDFSCFCI